jgi:hypothetical protein
LLKLNDSRAGRIEDQSDSICAAPSSVKSILDPGNTTNLDARAHSTVIKIWEFAKA